ncbi:MAG: NUDIX domain-containing protein [Eubacteriales bacterium]|nr:NUDIX domain-containing protein [Eubacteriales bacterium]
MEWLDVVDENGIPTGEIVERTRAHLEGIRHRTAHVWVMREREGGVEVLLQKRSACKDSHPGCYDISSAGHIPAGVDFIPSALRELKEELGIEAEAGELHCCGQRRFCWRDTFYGRPFIDNQVSNVYCLWRNIPAEKMTLQASEVESVRWINLEECKRLVKQNQIKSCIFSEELDLLPIKRKTVTREAAGED